MARRARTRPRYSEQSTLLAPMIDSLRMSYHLPLEVLDPIISFTEPDPDTGILDTENQCRKEYQLALSTVNKHCRQMMLPKLFASITIAYAVDMDGKHDSLTDMTCASTVAFCSAIVNGDPAATLFARTYVKTCTISTYSVEGSCAMDGAPITETWFAEFISCMQVLETLIIENHSPDSWSELNLGKFVPAGILVSLQQLPCLTKLRVTDEKIAEQLLARLMVHDAPGTQHHVAPLTQLQEMASNLTTFEVLVSKNFDPRLDPKYVQYQPESPETNSECSDRSTDHSETNFGMQPFPMFINLTSVSLTGYACLTVTLLIHMALGARIWCANLREVEFSMRPDYEPLDLVEFLNAATGLRKLRIDRKSTAITVEEATEAFKQLHINSLPYRLSYAGPAQECYSMSNKPRLQSLAFETKNDVGASGFHFVRRSLDSTLNPLLSLGIDAKTYSWYRLNSNRYGPRFGRLTLDVESLILYDFPEVEQIQPAKVLTRVGVYTTP
ncbi:hypothetical protein BDV98DRAFT_403796 [Pterulicium gracile]|uniref:Uncharacterized protein n=1 Tax=Pterulicium gracile TaxID=1884261 RepID=A0A5C3QML2_9AGAR|nr:hypothetical protein BDV98DRAFT_403796 [Pterula gracilis]